MIAFKPKPDTEPGLLLTASAGQKLTKTNGEYVFANGKS